MNNTICKSAETWWVIFLQNKSLPLYGLVLVPFSMECQGFATFFPLKMQTPIVSVLFSAIIFGCLWFRGSNGCRGSISNYSAVGYWDDTLGADSLVWPTLKHNELPASSVKHTVYYKGCLYTFYINNKIHVHIRKDSVQLCMQFEQIQWSVRLDILYKVKQLWVDNFIAMLSAVFFFIILIALRNERKGDSSKSTSSFLLHLQALQIWSCQLQATEIRGQIEQFWTKCRLL